MAAKAVQSLILSAGTGLTGGGNLSADRSFAVTGNLASIFALAGPGLISLTGTGSTAVARTITGTSGRISVTNGSGAGGNPTIDLSTVSGLTVGTYTKITVDAYGRATAGQNPTTLAGYGITDAIGGAGGTLTGPLGFSNSIAVGAPVINALSAGTRLLLRDTKAPGSADFAIGFNTDRLWLGVGQASGSQDIAFYAAATLLAKFAGDGVFTVYGQIRGTTKSFLIPHPSRKGWELEHGSLEGPEHAVFVRGRLIGKTKIELPRYWRKLVITESITVHLTARNQFRYWIANHNSDRVMVATDGDTADVDLDFFIVATRRDIPPLVPEQRRPPRK